MENQSDIIWYKINDLPNPNPNTKNFTIRIRGFDIVIAATNHEYFAFSALCPHAGIELKDCKVLDTIAIRCPGHGFVFDVKNGNCSHSEGRTLRVFPMKKEDNFWFIAIPVLNT